MLLGLDICDCLEDIEGDNSSLASFLACVEECISEREGRKFKEGLNKVKLATFGKNLNSKRSCTE